MDVTFWAGRDAEHMTFQLLDIERFGDTSTHG